MRFSSLCLVLSSTLAISPVSEAVSPPANRFARATDADVPEFTFDQLWNLQRTFWDNFMYPANVAQMESINSTIFDENVQGRVDISRTFDGRELNTEYIFGLFTDPTRISVLGTPISYEILQFSASQNIAASSTRIMFNGTISGAQTPVIIDTFVAWNKDGQIVQYDATFRWFEFLLDSTISIVQQRLNSSFAEAQAYLGSSLANSICGKHEQYCTGENQQYADTATCIDFMTKKIRFGKGYELGRNTILCRSVHEQMLRYRPDVHCSHIGPTGGGMCDDEQSYAERAGENHFTITPFVPYGYST